MRDGGERIIFHLHLRTSKRFHQSTREIIAEFQGLAEGLVALASVSLLCMAYFVVFFIKIWQFFIVISFIFHMILFEFSSYFFSFSLLHVYIYIFCLLLFTFFYRFLFGYGVFYFLSIYRSICLFLSLILHFSH